jgi:hypothetical protein
MRSFTWTENGVPIRFIVENSRPAASLDGGDCNFSVYLSAGQASRVDSMIALRYA